MSEEYHIYLVDIRDELQSFMHYDDITTKFLDLWGAWMNYCLRHKLRSRVFFTEAMQRGWLKRSDAESLCMYMHNGHFWNCLM